MSDNVSSEGTRRESGQAERAFIRVKEMREDPDVDRLTYLHKALQKLVAKLSTIISPSVVAFEEFVLSENGIPKSISSRERTRRRFPALPEERVEDYYDNTGKGPVHR
ncbi:uncharacterized protein EAE97_002372 [Botrytis byssoidea]|uniref:Uncharacterized protein n=1 Tax=Botrytis byssoidea TaxID=139641 RepID=A0A9P5IUH4_9HELO|nr:uncharacterized protein EAE97_002372 [Botrytis byssoidea]KAF7950820.1 hypothetical protein EAE97_002372 [Botrytis byssoidea]